MVEGKSFVLRNGNPSDQQSERNSEQEVAAVCAELHQDSLPYQQPQVRPPRVCPGHQCGPT